CARVGDWGDYRNYFDSW
nr:immunoglobulin heavy chain junction region [Macaca mulatta]MOV54223.1 immunoglobulin heavy chain junction region [Macaca mulatta]MOV54711.1 immunoglobulin heavy chain junction region [Macaca mulatta]MOV55224.1 immunoglobulin heavy chain junction region [Macaca mulatta]MOV55242.1 immunoglobulin heavy chain junction region [Macaca mulatta]